MSAVLDRPRTVLDRLFNLTNDCAYSVASVFAHLHRLSLGGIGEPSSAAGTARRGAQSVYVMIREIMNLVLHGLCQIVIVTKGVVGNVR